MSFAVSSIAMMGMGAASSVVGSYFGARSSQDTLRYQAGMADINARMAEQGAQAELRRGEREYQSSRLRTGQIKSSQRAAMAANGVDLGVGSAAEVLTSTDVMGEIDANTIQANAIRQAFGHRAQATNFQNEALIARAGADAINPGMAAFGTLLTEGSKVGMSYYQMNKAGAFNKPPNNAGDGLSQGDRRKLGVF